MTDGGALGGSEQCVGGSAECGEVRSRVCMLERDRLTRRLGLTETGQRERGTRAAGVCAVPVAVGGVISCVCDSVRVCVCVVVCVPC